MTTRQLEKMRLGRERQLRRLREQAIVNVREYREWLREDAAAFRTMRSAEATHGRDSAEFISAHQAWRRIAQAMPLPPSDAAFALAAAA